MVGALIMGIIVPRPAMRGKESRTIAARLAYYNARLAELRELGVDEKSARETAFKEAKAIKS